MKGNDKTRMKLLSALSKVNRDLGVESGKITVKSVATLAGVSHALVYRCYPDVLDKIRGLNDKKNSVRGVALSRQLKQTNFKLRERIEELDQVVSNLASRNAMLLMEVSNLKISLQAVTSGVSLINREKKSSGFEDGRNSE